MAGPAGATPAAATVDPNDLVEEIVRESQQFVEPGSAAAQGSDSEFDDCQEDVNVDHKPWTADRIGESPTAEGKFTELSDSDEDWAECRETPMEEVVAKMQQMKTKEEEERAKPTRIWTPREIEEGLAAADVHKNLGNQHYQKGENALAIDAYTLAIDKAPPNEKRAAVYFANRAACYMKMEMHQNVIEDCARAIELDPGYVKAVIRRAQAYEATDKLEDALDDYKRLKELEPASPLAREKIRTLPDQIKQQQERMKEEMLGKLKDLGNTVLGKFGMSLDNFKMVQQPDGTYSVNFQQ